MSFPDAGCHECRLYESCDTPFMEGSGSDSPTWLFVGEAPGGDEDFLGKPFVGKSGKLLRRTVREAGIPIGQARFTNTVRCRPVDNNLAAVPQAPRICKNNLLREIHVHQPPSSCAARRDGG